MLKLRALLKYGVLFWAVMASTAAFAQTPASKTFGDQIRDAIATYAAGDQTSAVSQFEELYRLRPTSVDVQSWLGFLYLRTDRAAQAVPLLEKANEAKPEDAEILSNLANAYVATGNDDAAITKFEKIVSTNPALYTPNVRLGNLFLKKRDYVKARNSFQRAVAVKDDDAASWNNIGVASEGLGESDRAVEAYDKAAGLNPNNKIYARNSGLARFKKADYTGAIPMLERAGDGNEDEVLALALAKSYLETKERAKALQYLETLKTSLSGSADFWFNLGVLRGQAGNSVGAEEAYRRGVDLTPTDAEALNNLALRLYANGNYRESRFAFARLAKLQPANIDAKLNYGSASLLAGDPNGAIEVWKEALRLRPNRIDIRLQLANALFLRRDFQNAGFHFEEVLKRDPKNAQALNGRGQIQLRASKFVEAEATFRNAIRSDRKLIAAYNNLAMSLEKLNRREEAISILQNAVKLGGSAEVRANLARMRNAG